MGSLPIAFSAALATSSTLPLQLAGPLVQLDTTQTPPQERVLCALPAVSPALLQAPPTALPVLHSTSLQPQMSALPVTLSVMSAVALTIQTV